MGTPLNNQQKQSNSEWSDMFQTGFSALSSFAIATASSTTQLAKVCSMICDKEEFLTKNQDCRRKNIRNSNNTKS